MSGTNWIFLLLMGIGLMLTNAALAAWTTGDPPPASIFAHRSIVDVVDARVASGTQNGSVRHIPFVLVRWNDKVVELHGLKASFYDYRQVSAEAAIGDIVAGQSIRVRVIDGTPYADRTDWLRLGGAVWLGLFAALALVSGAGLALCGRWIRRAGR